MNAPQVSCADQGASTMDIEPVESDITYVLTHAHSFALRQEILSLLNACQRAEHDSLEAMREIASNNTRQVLSILTQWICSGYVHASKTEIEEVQKISLQQHDEWLELVRHKNELDVTLMSTIEELDKEKLNYDKIAGPFGTKGFLAKGEEKFKILESKVKYEALKIKKHDLEKATEENNEKIRLYGDLFLKNSCDNLDKMSSASPLGEKLQYVVLETTRKLSEEWRRNCQKQSHELEIINKNVMCLNGMYSFKE